MPTDTFLPALESISLVTALFWVWLLCVVIFAAHWLIASYHWYSYGSERFVSLLSIVVYGALGGSLLIGMGSLLLFM